MSNKLNIQIPQLSSNNKKKIHPEQIDFFNSGVRS